MRPPAAVDEVTVAFSVAGQRLLGIIAQPAQPQASVTGIVLVVGGAQTRVGANRRFVGLARTLAAAGHAVMRFDQRGLGDSDGEHPGFESASADIVAATEALRSVCPQLGRLVFVGLCDGASAIALALPALPPGLAVSALVLVNPWVHSPALAAQARLKHHYRRRLLDPQWWKRLFSGRVHPSAWAAGMAALWRSRRAAPVIPFVERMALNLHAFHGRVLVVLSGQDQTAQEFAQLLATSRHWGLLAARPGWHTVQHTDADHTHSGRDAGEQLESEVLAWLQHPQPDGRA